MTLNVGTPLSGSQVLIFRANYAHTLVEVDDDGLFPSVIMSWSVTILAVWYTLMHVFKVKYKYTHVIPETNST